MSLLRFVRFMSAFLTVSVSCTEVCENSGRFMQFCPAACGLPLITLGGTEYYIHTSSNVIWFDAYKICKANDLALLSIETEDENNIIKRGIVSSNLSARFWTSGNDLEQEGNWIWRSTRQPFTFKNWEVNQPGDREKGLENCMYIGNDGNKWHDAPCTETYYFICEKTK
ncbi:hypothetical protein B566_EDAN010146 [Ephemera danica]|nr:hypothetical protein B566_EDAN010146 [Ephemera danica]